MDYVRQCVAFLDCVTAAQAPSEPEVIGFGEPEPQNVMAPAVARRDRMWWVDRFCGDPAHPELCRALGLVVGQKVAPGEPRPAAASPAAAAIWGAPTPRGRKAA